MPNIIITSGIRSTKIIQGVVSWMDAINEEPIGTQT